MTTERGPGRECYHCKQWIAQGEPHDCWTTTEAALTQDLSEDLLDAWERLRETAVALGEQRIYASHRSIVFSRRACHFFVRPKRSFLELCIFLGRPVNAPQVRRVARTSRTKLAHIIQIRHRDEVEAPLTDWLQEAYDMSDLPPAKAVRKSGSDRSASTTAAKTKVRPKARAKPVSTAKRVSQTTPTRAAKTTARATLKKARQTATRAAKRR
jgi:hypothetical protein